MKLVSKMTLAIVAAMTFVVVVYATVSIQVHRQQLIGDSRHDGWIAAEILADGTAVAFAEGGEAAARDFVEAVDRNHFGATMQWTSSVDGPAPKGSDVEQTMSGTGDERTVVTHAWVRDSDGAVLGRVSIVDGLAEENEILRARLVRLLVATIAMALVGVAVAVALGRRFVAGPVRALRDHAARIGRGQLQPPLVLPGRDELAELATAMNAMADEIESSSSLARRETEARIETLEQLRHAERLATVGRLAAGIAHELGTPLNVVAARATMIERGLADGLASGEEDVADLRRYAVVIREQSAKMTAIIRQLLGFARHDRGPTADVDLASLTLETVALVRPLAERRGVQLEVALDPDLPAVVRGDASQLEQVITNIVVNAIQACRQGGRVEVSSSRSDADPPPDVAPAPHGFVCIEVRDDGSGISATNLTRIFEPFFTTKDVGQGSGLGLSVAYGIVRDHGGYLDAQSTEGAGSTFTAHVPARHSSQSSTAAESG